jgi:hypothetical protein
VDLVEDMVAVRAEAEIVSVEDKIENVLLSTPVKSGAISNSESIDSFVLLNDSEISSEKNRCDNGGKFEVKKVLHRLVHKKIRKYPLPMWVVVACDGFWDVCFCLCCSFK